MNFKHSATRSVPHTSFTAITHTPLPGFDLKKKYEIDLRQTPDVNDYYVANKYQNALNKYDKAIKLDPRKEYFLNKAITLNILMRHQDAVNVCTRALQIDPNYIEARLEKAKSLYFLANEYFDKSLYTKALDRYNITIELVKDFKPMKEFFSNKAAALNSLKRYSEAIKAADEALKIDPKYKPAIKHKAKSHNKRGYELFKRGRYIESLADYDIAINLGILLFYFQFKGQLNVISLLSKIKIKIQIQSTLPIEPVLSTN
jgi:tetratricopeptide (TPR) repeat protein